MQATSHLNTLQLSLSHERSRLAAAKTQGEIDLRSVWVMQLEKEVATEKAFLGVVDAPADDLSEDDLLAELGL